MACRDLASGFAGNVLKKVGRLRDRALRFNSTPVGCWCCDYGMLRQWQLYFQSQHPEANVQFHSYWNLSRTEAESICETGVPGHTQEYETLIAWHLFPENVRHDAMQDQEDQLPLKATKEKGEQFFELAVQNTVDFLQRMINGGNREIRPHLTSWQLDPKVGSDEK